MPHKLLLAPLHVVHHGELYARVVYLLEADYHPEEMGKCPPQFGKVYPVFQHFSAVVSLLQLTIVYRHDLVLHLQLHFQVLPDLESGTVLRGPLIQEIAQVVPHRVELAELKVNNVLSLIGRENVAEVAVIMAQHPWGFLEDLQQLTLNGFVIEHFLDLDPALLNQRRAFDFFALINSLENLEQICKLELVYSSMLLIVLVDSGGVFA